MTVAIVGAGPAGLAAAAALAETGVPYVVLERGDSPCAALRTLDHEMQLLTPARFSTLPGMPPGDGAYWRFGELVGEIERWRAARGLSVTTGASVTAIAPASDGFEVRYERAGREHVLAASHVINATGIIGHPRLPAEFSPDAYGARWCHSAAVRTADLEAARRLFVVGAGMSAAEVIERWLEVRRPDDRAWLSSRRRVRAVPAKLLGLDVHWFLWVPDRLPGRVGGRRIGPGRDLIIGRSVLGALRRGDVARAPAVAQFERGAVVLADGARVEPDLLVLATGFRYTTSHLAALVDCDADGWPIVDRHSASTRTRDLYILGARFGRTTSSGRLAGISRDAVHVARRIARRA